MRVVLDTNVVIDWLVFDHPFMTPLREGISAQSIDVVSHALAVAELARVLRYPMLKLSESRCEVVLRSYAQHSTTVDVPEGFGRGAWRLPASFPSCRDRDDDLFLALAFHSQADALITRDKELLKMRKRLRRFNVSIYDVPQFIERIKEPAASVSLIAGSN